MRYRQIHLDFHTSPVISDVGKDFDKEAFAKTLKDAKVESINIFAKCHHGMCYYPTKVGKMHPALTFDLMGEMIDVLHKNGIRCPLYFPIGWEEDAAEHAQWLEVGEDGLLGHKTPFHAGWRKLCHNKPEYIQYIKAQLEELIEHYDVDGFWFDIIFQSGCVCGDCIKSMKKLGLDPQNYDDVLKHDFIVLKNFQSDLNDFIKSKGLDIPIFYNAAWRPDGGYNEYTIENRSKLQSHIEIESLPSEFWGYNHFPLFVNYFNRNNTDLVGMNGKFLSMWGDHGSLRNTEALEYECFRMIANGAACSVGDQLHPRGVLDKTVYKRIGHVFSEVEKREPWCKQSSKVADIGVIMCAKPLGRDFTSDEGVMRMLFELHYTFDFITIHDALDKYKLVILPDEVIVDDALSKKLKQYMKNGGKVIATYRSMHPDMGIEYLGDNEFCPSYMVINENFSPAIDPMAYVCYERGAYVSSNLEPLVYVGKPYFNRTYDCFSSHKHFPYEKTTTYPAILKNESLYYCAYPLFKDYRKSGNRIYRDIIQKMMEDFLPLPVVKAQLPTCAEVTVRTQKDRMIVHILNYIAERRAEKMDIVDTKIPLYNIDMKVRCSDDVTVYLAPSMEQLEYTREGAYIHVTIPEINGYALLVLEKTSK